jgi:hypothetical protein
MVVAVTVAVAVVVAVVVGLMVVLAVATPRPQYHWKAETLSFLHVLLHCGVILVSLFINIY